MAAADDARKASDQFYGALNRMITGDASSMAEIWSQSATVTTMHPIGGREVGILELSVTYVRGPLTTDGSVMDVHSVATGCGLRRQTHTSPVNPMSCTGPSR